MDKNDNSAIDSKNVKYILFAFLAALLYSTNIPLSKLLLGNIGPTLLAGFLYLGAGVGMFILFFINKKRVTNFLCKKDLPFVILMVVLDIAAPILLMLGLTKISAGNASLLNNFEIVATAIIALIIFKEKISFKLWVGILLVTISSFFLCFEDLSSFQFNEGSIFVLLATLCWGLENNCTKKISDKNTYEIVAIKGLFSGLGSIIIGLILKEQIATIWAPFASLGLGFVAYGLSIFFYVKAQSKIGAAKTSAFYAVNPFVATLISVLIFNETLFWNYYVGLAIMVVGSVIIVIDTLFIKQKNNKENNI